MSAKPSIGRTVHYVLPAGPNVGQHRPAIVTNLVGTEGLVALTVFPDVARDRMGSPFHTAATSHNEAGHPDTWHWPEREDSSLPIPTKNEGQAEVARAGSNDPSKAEAGTSSASATGGGNE